jgi:hypothetical protein
MTTTAEDLRYWIERRRWEKWHKKKQRMEQEQQQSSQDENINDQNVTQNGADIIE